MFSYCFLFGSNHLWPLAELHDDGREKTEHHQSHADHESLRLLFYTHFNLRLGVRHPPNSPVLGTERTGVPRIARGGPRSQAAEHLHPSEVVTRPQGGDPQTIKAG